MSVVNLIELVRSPNINTPLVRDKLSALVENHLSMSLEEIKNFKNATGNIPELKIFYYFTLLIKLDQETKPFSGITELLEESSKELFDIIGNKEIDDKKIYMQSIFSTIDDILLNQILASEKEKDILTFSKTAHFLLQQQEGIVSPSAAYNKLVPKFYQKVSRLLDGGSTREFADLIEDVKRGLEIELKLNSVSHIIISSALTAIEVRNNFFTGERPANSDPDDDWDILLAIEDMKIEDGNLKDNFESVRKKVEEINPRRQKKDIDKKSQPAPSLEPHFGVKKEDLKSIEQIGERLRRNDLTVQIFKAEIDENKSLQKVAIKSYNFQQEDAYYMKKIENEIFIYQKLSSLKQINNSFAKFYGYFTDEVTLLENRPIFKSINLVMEYKPNSLNDWIERKVKLDNVNYLTLFARLIRTYADMHGAAIYHLDVTPRNIILEDQYKLAIIDFDISAAVTAEESKEDYNGKYLIQGTEKYMPPEILIPWKNGETTANYSRSKVDVYGLGLVLLELITSELVNNNEEAIRDAINRVEIDWVKGLLDLMLKTNPEERKSFRELVAFINKIETVTFSFRHEG